MPQTLTKVQIANLALTFIGAKPITAFTDTTQESVKIGLVWEAARMAVLRAHNWKFAKRRITLTVESTITHHGWTYIWDYPSYVAAIRKIYVTPEEIDPDPVDYDVFSGTDEVMYIATNEVYNNSGTNEAYAEVTYYGETTDEAKLYAQYDSAFAVALAAQAAYLLAQPLTGKNSIKEDMLKLYNQVLNEAKLADSREGRVKSVRATTSSFVTARS